MRVAVPAAWRTRVTPERRQRVRDDHRAITAAIDDADPDRAVAAMEAHFDASVIRAARVER